MGRIARFIKRLKIRISLNKKQFAVYTVLRALVILTGIRSLATHNYESAALCALILILFLVPSFFEELLEVSIPPVFQVIIYTFIYAAEILGEVNKYYTVIPGWDTMLHTINGFLCAAIGLSLVFILNRRDSKNLHLSPFYLAMAAFCFSMTIGVIWEFIEYTADYFLYLDMQKDVIIKDIGSISLDTTGSQIPVRVSDITRTVIETGDGSQVVVEGGYLDVGINDTMKDLLVNFLGALTFCVIGYFYEKKHGFDEKVSVKSPLLIKPLSKAEVKLRNELIFRRMNRKRKEKAKEEAE